MKPINAIMIIAALLIVLGGGSRILGLFLRLGTFRFFGILALGCGIAVSFAPLAGLVKKMNVK